jgi:4-pyridoxolactonase
MDHVGGNKFFPHAVKICQRAEHDRALAPRRFEAGAYGDLSFSAELAERRGRADALRHGQTAHNTDFTLLEGDAELAKGVQLISTPGHSAGHCSLLLEPPGRRPMLFPFDAAYTKRNMTAFIQGGFHSDPSAGERSLQRLIDIVDERDAEIVFTHDPDAPQLAIVGDLLACERRAR